MDDRLYKIRLVILWTAAGLLVLVGGALLALQTDTGKAYVLEELTGRLNEKLAGEVQAEEISGPMLWGATLHDFELRDGRANDVLRVGEVEVYYSLVGLLTGDFEFSRVHLEQPEMHVRRYEDGTFNLATLTKPALEPDADVEAGRELLTIPRVTISNGTLHYDGEMATDVDARGGLSVYTMGAYEATVDEISLKTDAGPLTRALEVAAEDVRVEGSANRIELAAAEIVVDETSRIDGLDLTRTVTDEGVEESEGAAESEAGRFVGSFETLSITPRLAKLWSSNLDLASPIEVRAAFEGTPDDLELEGVATVDGSGKVEFDGTLDAAGRSVDLAVTAKRFQPADWVEAEGPPVQLDATGTLAGRLTDSGSIEATTRLDATNIEFGENRVEKLQLGGKAPFSIHLGPAGDDGAKRRLKASGEIDATGVVGGDIALETVDARIAITAKSIEPGAPIGYDITGTASRASFREHTTREHTADSAKFDLKGTLVRAPTAANEAVEKLVAKGTLDMRGYGGGGVEIRRLDARVDVEHTPTSNTGDVRADLDRLVSNDRTYGSGRVTLDISQGRKFNISVRAVPNIAPNLPLSLLTAGVHSEDFGTFELSQFDVGRPGLEWKLRDQASVRLGEETVVIDSLVLQGPTQPIRLDGTYPRDRAAAAIIERLALVSLQGLMQGENIPEKLRDQLPDDLGDVAPDELKEAIPDEVEERLSDEIRRRLPKF